MSFDKWQARLAGQKVVAWLQPDALDEGYYRKPLGEKQPNGRFKITGYLPVAYFIEGNRLVGIIGDRDMTDHEVTDETLWSYVVTNPIAYEWFQAVAERGEPWPDVEKWTSPVPARMSDNQPTDLTADETWEKIKEENNLTVAEPEKPRHEVLAAAIKAEIEAAPKAAKTVEDANRAAGAKNKIAELRLTAAREGEAIYKPPFAEYKRLFATWDPMVKTAAAAEAGLNKMVLSFRETERKKAEAAAAEAARIQQEQDAANERAAQRAIARGEVEEMPLHPPVEAAPAVPPAPAPVQPTYGKRVVKEEVKKFAVVNDFVAAFTHFKNDPELRARIEKLSTDAIRAGAVIPGVTYREGLI